MADPLEKLSGILVATENVTLGLERLRLKRSSGWWTINDDASEVAAMLDQIRRSSLLNADYAAELLAKVREEKE